MLTTTLQKRRKTIFDYLSELPDEMLHSILDFLPLDNAARTAALSRRWRHVWCSNPSISFAFLSHHSINPSTYTQIVDSALSLCSSIQRIASVSFVLNPCDPDIDAVTRRWISFAASRSVQSLSLDSGIPKYFILHRSEYEHPFDMHRCVVACPDIFCCQTLRSLNLRRCIMPPLPDNHDKLHFPFLESLKFQGVGLDKKILVELISSSPRLKHLSLDQVSSADDLLEISSPTLEILDVRHANPASNSDVPASLFDLTIQVFSVPKLCFLGLCVELRQAKLFNLVGADNLEEVTLLWYQKEVPGDINQWRKMMSIAQKVITLVIDCWFLQTYDLRSLCCHGPFFSNLRRLQICGITPQWLPHLIATLQNCPILEHLQFRECYECAGETMPFTGERKSKKAKLLEESTTNSLVIPPLKVVQIAGKSYDAEGVWMELIEFILGNAATLESLVVYYRKYYQASYDGPFEHIKSFYRASPHVKLVFTEDMARTRFGHARVCGRNNYFDG